MLNFVSSMVIHIHFLNNIRSKELLQGLSFYCKSKKKSIRYKLSSRLPSSHVTNVTSDICYLELFDITLTYCRCTLGQMQMEYFHPSIFDRFSGVRSRRQQQGCTDTSSGSRGVPGPAKRHSHPSLYWVFPRVSSTWGIPGTPPGMP